MAGHGPGARPGTLTGKGLLAEPFAWQLQQLSGPGCGPSQLAAQTQSQAALVSQRTSTDGGFRDTATVCFCAAVGACGRGLCHMPLSIPLLQTFCEVCEAV